MIDKPINRCPMEQNTEKFSILNSQFSILTSYFPDLTDRQKEQYAALYDLYTDWNAKINVISRKDIENLYPASRASLAGYHRYAAFQAGFLGDGSGYGRRLSRHPLGDLIPGDPFPSGRQHREKIKVGQAVAEAIGLENVSFRHCRGEEEKQLFDFVVSRAVMPLADLVKIVRKNIKKEQIKRIAQRIDLPERWRAGARDIAFPEPSDKHGSERPF